MLLYYFDDKNDALTAALAVVAEQFAAGLSAAFDDRRQPARALLESVNALMLGDEVGSLMRLWLEIVAKSASREPPYPDVARSIANTFIDWIEAHLDTVGLADPRGTAAAILATVDGLAMLKLCAPDDVVARAARQAAASSMNSG
jgi:AcrR family transcriptional regulator